MDVADQTRTKDGWIIFALANDRTIEIEREALTRRVARIRVIALKGNFFFKHAATATEIIVQMAETMARTSRPTVSMTARRAVVATRQSARLGRIARGAGRKARKAK